MLKQIQHDSIVINDVKNKDFKMQKWLIGLGIAAILPACVTINIYFPAAAAEKAADEIIEEVWQLKDAQTKPSGSTTKESPTKLPDTKVPDSKIPVDKAPAVKAPDAKVQTTK